MPTYEYVCEKCGHEFEQFQSIKAKPLTTCPQEVCPQKKWGKGKVRKAISAGGGLIFKGSGLYITDYRSETYKEAAKKETTPASSGASTDSKGTSGGGSDTKPGKAESKPAASTSAKKT